MQDEGNDCNFRIVELDESTRRADGPQGVESYFFHNRTGAKRAVTKIPGHCSKYSTWYVEVVYWSNN